MSAADPTGIFRQEAAELLDSLEVTLLDLGGRPTDQELVDTAFRAMHTLKGSGAMFGFDRLAAFTHDFETAFDLVRQGKVTANRDLLQVALAARDHMRLLIEDPDSADAIIGQAILGNLQVLVASDDAPVDVVSAAAPKGRGWRIAFRFRTDALRNGTNPLALIDELRELGECTARAELGNVPTLDALRPHDLHIGWTVDLVSGCSRQAIDDVFVFVLDDMQLDVTPLGAPAAEARTIAAEATPPVEGTGADAPADIREPARRAEDRSGGSIRVPSERLDELMDRVGELVTAQARLSQLAHGRVDPNVKAVAEEIERLSAGLRDITMGIRMMSMEAEFFGLSDFEETFVMHLCEAAYGPSGLFSTSSSS